MASVLRLNPGLQGASRFHHFIRRSESITALEWGILLSAGIAAALSSTLVNLHVRVPGHAILKVVFPIAAGLAIVPRRGAGTVACASALATAFTLRFVGYSGSGLGFGAMTSLTLIGPLLDWTLRHASSSRAVYVGVMLAGLAANLLALLVRGSLKAIGLEHAGGRPLSIWLSQAVVTYTLCGLAAGLLSAFIWFCARSDTADSQESSP